jgi:hypothetical protein
MGNEPKEAAPAKNNVGQLLRRRRTSLRLSLTDVELGTKIRGKYLVKLEAGDYSDLPNDIYMRGFVYNYADYLGLNPEAAVAQYVAERGEPQRGEVKSPQLAKPKQIILTPKLVALAGSLLAGAAIIGYLSWQFSALGAAPRLELESPTGEQVIYGALVDVRGRASGGADVFINDSPVLTDAQGGFNDKLALQEGVNVIKVTARNRLGKSTSISRDILAKVPEVAKAEAAVPESTFDGVAIAVTIKNTATWLIIEVDGKEAFRGTMLAGTSQQFRGSRIKLSTGNAGNTKLQLTNAIVARKVLDPIGPENEIKRNLEFAKDTSFQ